MGLLPLTGCRTPATTDAPRALAVDAREYDRLFEAAVAELRDAGFVIERRDHRFGRITTEPRDVPTAAEFWSPAALNRGLAAAASLAHLQWTVTVMLDPIDADTPPGSDDAATAESAGPTERYRLAVEVLIEREQRPTQRLSGTASRDVFEPLAAAPAAWDQRGITAAYFEPVGRDEAVEAKLLRRIVQRSLQMTDIDPGANPER